RIAAHDEEDGLLAAHLNAVAIVCLSCSARSPADSHFGHAPPCFWTRAPRKRPAGAMNTDARPREPRDAGREGIAGVNPAPDEPFFLLGLERLLGLCAPYRSARDTADAAGVRACRRTSSASSTKTKESSRRSSSGTSSTSRSFRRGRITDRIPARCAARTFSLIPPTGSTLPRT